MAKNKAKMNKFVTGVATAAMVATAVVPVASAAGFNDLDGVDASVKAEIDKAVTLGFFIDSSKFNPSEHITRGQAALTLARYIAGDDGVKAFVEEKNLESKVTPFGDVPASYRDGAEFQQELYYASLVVKNAGAFTQDNLNPAGNVTRSQMAKIITETFELETASDYESKLTDVEHLDAVTKGYIDTIASQDVTNVTAFMPAGHVTRSQMASFLVRSYDVVNADATVATVTATNSTTLTVAGTNLKGLKAEDITVDNNTVKSVVASTDGKTATVTLNSKLVVDAKTEVAISGKKFEVTYTIQATGVSVVSATYDDDTKDQYIAITIDGKKITAQELIDAGYNVEFTGFAKKSGTKLNHLFTSGSAASTTGELSTELGYTGTGSGTSIFVDELATAGVISSGATELPTAGVGIFVQVKITKGTETIQSEVSPIKIQNVDLATDSIKEYTLENFGKDKTDDGSADAEDVSLANDDFLQNSTTLVTGEKAAVRNITIVNDGKEELVTYGSKLVTVTTSNEAVVSVDATTGALTAQTPGTATITLAYGTQTKTVAITVTNTKRALNKAVITEDGKAITTKTMIKIQGNKPFVGKVYDQYGDPIATDVTAKATNASTTTPIAYIWDGSAEQAEHTVTSNTEGEFTYTVVPKNAGSVVTTFHDAAGNKLTNSQLRVNVTDNADLSYYEVLNFDKNADKVLDSLSTDDNAAKFKFVGFTSEKNSLGAETLTGANIIKSTQTNTVTSGFTIKWAESVVGLVDTTGGTSTPGTTTGVVIDTTDADAATFTTTPGKTGTVTVTIIDNANNKESSITYTVKAEGDNIKAGALKTIPVPTFAKVIDYKDVLTHKQSENDPIISGLTLTSSTAQPVRLDLTGAVNAANAGTVAGSAFYIDKNANGVYDADDVVVGELQLTLVGTFANNGGAVAPAWSNGGLPSPFTPDTGDKVVRGLDTYTHDGTNWADSLSANADTIVAGILASPTAGDTVTVALTSQTYAYSAGSSAAADEIIGVTLQVGDNGTIIYKVLDKDGNVVADTNVKVSL